MDFTIKVFGLLPSQDENWKLAKNTETVQYVELLEQHIADVQAKIKSIKYESDLMYEDDVRKLITMINMVPWNK